MTIQLNFRLVALDDLDLAPHERQTQVGADPFVDSLNWSSWKQLELSQALKMLFNS